MAEDQEKKDPIEFWNAILIALVTVIAALVAWRASVSADGAGDADYAGLNAVVNREKTDTLAAVESAEHARAFAAYRRYRQTAEILAPGEKANKVAAEADALADAKLTLFPNKYMEREGTYRIEREMGTIRSNEARTKDLDPADDFEDADKLRDKTEKLLYGVVYLTFSLICLTLVEAFQGGARLMFLGGGVLIGIAATVYAGVVEMHP